MKRLKRVFSLFLTMLMLLSCMFISASATETNNELQNSGDKSLTITATENTHRYVIYQLFKGTPNDDGTLTYITWGTSVVKNGSYDLSAKLIAQLQRNTLPDGTESHISSYFTNLTETSSADYVAAAYVKLCGGAGTNQDVYQHEFASIVNYVLTEMAPAGTQVDQYNTPTMTEVGSSYSYVFSDIAGGFYLVDEDPDVSNTEVSYSRYILSVANDEEAVDKSESTPTLKEVIVTTKTKVDEVGADFAESAIGDEVTIRLKSAVPDMTYYGSKYYFVMTVTLSKGLTYNANTADMVVQVGDTKLVNKTEATENDAGTYEVNVTPQNDGTTKLEIVFNNFVQYKSNQDDPVVVWFDATLNENAVIGNGADGIDNTSVATLTYSNDPNYIYQGESSSDGTGNPDRPGTNEPVGKTPNDTVYVYTTAIDLFKKSPEGKPLTGAKFKIEGTALSTVVVKTSEFVEATSTVPEGTVVYYKLNDGTYTTDAPTEETTENYESTSTTYVMSTTSQSITISENESEEVEVGQDGCLHLEGLKSGEYTITETLAPTGYEKPLKSIKIKISYTSPTDTAIASGCIWAAEILTENDVLQDCGGMATLTVDSNSRISLAVENTARKILPTTGGMGTTIFYAAGSVLFVGALVLLITKGRVKKNRK